MQLVSFLLGLFDRPLLELGVDAKRCANLIFVSRQEKKVEDRPSDLIFTPNHQTHTMNILTKTRLTCNGLDIAAVKF